MRRGTAGDEESRESWGVHWPGVSHGYAFICRKNSRRSRRSRSGNILARRAWRLARSVQQQPIYAAGEPIVTGFSGVLPPSQQPPPGVDPLDLTFINPDGASMLIQQLQPNGPPQGQLIPSPPVFAAKAGDVGQVFSITLDDAPDETGALAPNIYLAATSAFGLNLVVPDASGNPVRSKTGAANAQFMPGQWGMAGGQPGGPGTIYKVDGTTGQITPFATIPGNTGAGLGNIAFDPASQQFFVSDLDNGLIYRIGTDGAVIDSFDHGVTARPNHSLAPVPDDGSEIDIINPAFSTEDRRAGVLPSPSARSMASPCMAAASTTPSPPGRRSGRWASMPTAALPMTRAGSSTSRASPRPMKSPTSSSIPKAA